MDKHRDDDTKVSVVIPVYNSADCLSELHSKLTYILEGLKITYEIILVNDCSTDVSWRVISDLAESSSNL